MGLCNSSDIFQEKMNELCNGLEYVRAYIGDDLLRITNSNCEDHLNKTKIVLKNRLCVCMSWCRRTVHQKLVEEYGESNWLGC